ncbi:adenylate/guanylate cyclase domain-containing protein [Candidatus Mycobacterium wuenschmannii]|uniref:Adenylate/guanylate cyclase domain-containing protein n=1 Tax=Candidatus Mycobacterium wuenschmannii TaxID=3027808 RepID=A0ABY8VXM0_9MYCO|nr:adenylate/guanylate cyclase domain-containing protein [Candidatus Mycobacterium wuenschmannii]WIM88380.1 adenylate/guanylate cyclase domain-containing protein [Candidatus Mycobacterium wuenschmannii]
MSTPGPPRTIDDLLDRAVQAINSGDRATASALAQQVLAVDSGNLEAEDLLATPAAGTGELRRLTILFADVVDSTALSTRIEPEIYRTVIGRYRQQVNDIVNRYEGHVFSTKGDGLLAVFGHPKAHENDVRRAVQAGLDISREVARLSAQVRARFDFDISVRAGIHRGVVYLDVEQDDVYGLGANLASRVSGLAPPGCVVVSGSIAPLARAYFELEAKPPQTVKGIDEPVEHHLVHGERISWTRIPLGPLVGRQKELEYLQASWELAAQGTLTTPGVGFIGEAGVGKSRLATVAADIAEQSGNPVLALIGSPFHGDVGLYPIRAMLEQRCGIDRTTEQTERLRLLDEQVRAHGFEPESAVPLLALVLGISTDHGYEPVRAEGAKLSRLIAKAILHYFSAIVGESPAVILAEDLQWFDPSTLEVVESLLRIDTGRMFVVLTGRDADSLPNITGIKTFRLSPLTATETDELITALDPTLSADERAEVQHRCDGVPLYIEEIVTKLHEQPSDGARWARVPDALYEPLFARLRASDITIQVVEAAATIGREFDRAILRTVLDMTESDFDDAIRDLETALVFEPTTMHSWRFRHQLLREVAYELPPPSVQRILHSRVADALVGDSDHPDWHLVALHYEQAERFDESANAFQQAATDARRRGALDEARACLTRAIAQVARAAPGSARDRREVRLRLRRGFLASAAEGTASSQAAVDFERCLELAGTDLRESDLVATLTALWAYYLPRGDLRRTIQVSDSIRRQVPTDRHWFWRLNNTAYGMVAWYGGDFDEARELLEESISGADSLARPVSDPTWFVPNEPVASMHTHLGLARFVQGELRGAEVQLGQAVRRANDLSFPQGPFSLAYERCYEIWVRIESHQLAAAAEIASHLKADAKRHGFDFWFLMASAQEVAINGLSALAAGRHDPAELGGYIAMMLVTVQSWRAAEATLFVSFYDAVLAQLLTAAGKFGEARERLDIALQLGEETGVNFYRAELLRLRARVAADAAARDADLQAAVDTARRQNASIFELRSAIDTFELHGDPSEAVLADTVSRFPGDSDWPDLVRARTLLG